MKLNTKFGLLLVASSILGLVVIIALSLVVGDIFGKGYAPHDLNAIGNQIAQQAPPDDANPEQFTRLLEQTVSEHPQLDFEWVAGDGSVLYATNGRSAPYTFNEITSRFLHIPDRFWGTEADITLAFALEHARNPQYVLMQIPHQAMQGSQAQIKVKENRDIIFLALPFLLFLATPYFVSFIFFMRMNYRLKKLIHAMNVVDVEKTGIAINDQSKDEIGQLTRHFNMMSERISDRVAQIQEFERNKKTLIANLSHDLRTPMTKIQGYAETLHDELDDSAKESKTFADIILRHSRYMGKLLQKLLEISDLDTRKGSIHLHKTNVSEHVRKIAADFVPVLENKAMAFDIHIPDQAIYVLTDAHLFERAIRNIIENAVQYGSSGHYLGIFLEQAGDEVRIRITDRGPGIPKEQLPLIFERFYRGSAARKGEGMGIGLTIVREIVEEHKGKIDVHSVQNKETVFTITLPCYKEG